MLIFFSEGKQYTIFGASDHEYTITMSGLNKKSLLISYIEGIIDAVDGVLETLRDFYTSQDDTIDRYIYVVIRCDE